ncbi:MAG TPA: pyrroloquinoline quinone biosynthesis peptide chaperone PqqD [Methylomirabilota bacterium]|jgi:coenzyme PQQ biosynthesis protein PqqD|nr:pyrroloquinoline quinone biosynthesis peptide chaperone PqqD [Methylomirabilota bacterium]
MIAPTSRPRLAPKVRVRFDRRGQQYLLLYPEKGLALNPTAAAVVSLCTGEHTVEAIVEQLAAKCLAEPRERVERDILAFLQAMTDRGLVKDGS